MTNTIRSIISAIFSIIFATTIIGCSQSSGKGVQLFIPDTMKYNFLTEIERYVIEGKGTEEPFSGEYNDFFEEGVYVCKRCGAELYRSTDKFKSSCGWPSFDDEIEGAVKRLVDADGVRTEIQCSNCGAHLGHVFVGEGFTDKNTRHCVNSVSLRFIPSKNNKSSNSNMTDNLSDQKTSSLNNGNMLKTIYFAGGCFWGTEHYFKQLRGVVETEVGYANGHTENPTYTDVCTDQTGFAETVRIVYDPSVINLEFLTEMYFKAIDPISVNKQGHDVGTQYRTGIYFTEVADRPFLERVYQRIEKEIGKPLAVQLQPLENFYTAEEYHQDYLDKNPDGYCHLPVELFKMAKEANR